MSDAPPELSPSAGAAPAAATPAPATVPAPMQIGPRRFEWGSRTFVMAILNVTPDSFSGDGLLMRPGDARALAVEAARRMVADGADILDIGGESTRPGHTPVDALEEAGRVVPVIAAVRAALPDVPIGIDTTKPAVATAALHAGANLLNDVWGVSTDDSMLRLAARRGVPLVVMHNRAEAQYDDVMAEVVDDLRRAIERAEAAGLPRERILVDPGFGFGKTPAHNLEVLRRLGELRQLGRPVLLGTSRKSTLGKLLGGLPPDQRVEATLATTALGIVAGIDVVRVHDVEANVRVARVCDAVVRTAGGAAL